MIASDISIELGVLNDGGVLLVSDQPLPAIVKRVEYYAEQRLFNLVYFCEDTEEDLVEYEVPQDLASRVEGSADMLIYSLFEGQAPLGYRAPLIQVGVGT